MRQTPKIHEIYKHFKGNYYQIEGLAIDAETEQTCVVYRATYGDHALFVRTVENFLSPVDKEKYPDASQEYRFELVEDTMVQDSIDQDLNDLLDAKTNEDRLKILECLHERINDNMINTIAIVFDYEIPEGPIEERYMALHDMLSLRIKYEGSRLR